MKLPSLETKMYLCYTVIQMKKRLGVRDIFLSYCERKRAHDPWWEDIGYITLYK